VREGKVPEGLSPKLAGWNVCVTDYSLYQSSMQLSTSRVVTIVPQTVIHDPQTFSVTICRGMTKVVTYYNTFHDEISKTTCKVNILVGQLIRSS
jgi:hypothetical protein